MWRLVRLLTLLRLLLRLLLSLLFLGERRLFLLLLLAEHRSAERNRQGDRASAAILAETGGVDRAQTDDQAIGRGCAQKFFHRTSASLRRDGQPAIFDEASGVAEIFDILPCGTAALRMAPGDSLGASSFMSQLMASNHFSEIGANRVQIRGYERRGRRAFHVSGFDEQQRLTHRRHIALGRRDRVRDRCSKL